MSVGEEPPWYRSPMDYMLSVTDAPKGFRYPVKRKALEAAVKASGISCLRAIYFLPGERNGWLLTATYRGGSSLAHDPGPAFPPEPGCAAIGVHAVPKKDREAARRFMDEQGLPALTAWLQRVESESDSWRQQTHRLEIRHADGRISIEEH